MSHPQNNTILEAELTRPAQRFTDVREAVRFAIDEFHECAEAKQYGYHYDTSRLQELEAATILRYLPEGGALLDVGTGSGVVPRALQLMGAEVHSVDFPKTGGTEALSRLMGLGIKGYYADFGGDGVPLAEGTIDVVFCGNIIEHLPHTPRYFLAEARRVLKPGGHLVIDTKNAVDLKTRLKMLGGISNWPAIEGVYEHEYNYYHHKEYTLDELAEAVKRSGFEIRERISEEVFFRRSLKRLGSLRLMGGDRSKASKFGTGFNPFHPYEYVRMLLLANCILRPNLRSDILVVGQKPV